MRAKYMLLMGAISIGVCVGCGDDDSKTGSASETMDDSTKGSTSDPTGEPTTAPATATGGTTGDESTGGTTGDDPTGGTTGSTGEPDGTPCEKAATWLVMCDPESPPKDELVAGCEETRELVELQGPSCAAQYDEAQECLGALTCESDTTACEAMLEAAFTCVEIGEVCQAFGAKSAECNPDDPASAEDCQLTLNYAKTELGEACATAWEQYTACYGQQTCADLESGACSAEAMAYIETCEE